MSGPHRPGRRYVELAPDADALTRLSRALEVARRRLRRTWSGVFGRSRRTSAPR